MTSLSNVEAKKRFELLEAVSASMDAHIRYFKQVNFYFYFLNLFVVVEFLNLLCFQGYELLHQMEPYINQVCTYWML